MLADQGRRAAFVLFLLLMLPSVVFANGAMGLGLEMWEYSYWFAYVLAMIILEAWLIGRWMKASWLTAFGISFLANFVTGAFCGASGLFAPFLHGTFLGSTIDPNPFWNSVVLLTVFAIPSAWFESMIWRWLLKPERVGRVVLRSLVIHLITVPVALGILLVPERPYRGIEYTAQNARRRELLRLSDAVGAYVSANGTLPQATTADSVLAELSPFIEDAGRAKYALYAVDLSRFSTGEEWGRPFEVNAALAGRKIPVDAEMYIEEWKWYMRSPSEARVEGILVDVNSGQARFSASEPDFVD